MIIVALVIFLLSNRQPTAVAFWPFGSLGEAVLGAIVLIAFALGILAGMLIHVPHRVRAQRRARKAERELAALRRSMPAAPAPAKDETKPAVSGPVSLPPVA